MKVLIFAPYSLIWVHAFPEALIGEALQQSGHEITYVTCGETLRDYCQPMGMKGLSTSSPLAKRERVCSQCSRTGNIITSRFDFSSIRLADLVRDEDHALAERILQSTSGSKLQLTEIDGIPVGRLALYQLLLELKRIDIDFDEKELNDYRVELKHVILVLQAFKRLFSEQRFDRVIVYNALYSINRAVCLLAQRHGIPDYFVHAGGNLSQRLQSLVLARGHTFEYYDHLKAQWQRFSDIPVTSKLAATVTSHYVDLMKGRSLFGYSSAVDGTHKSLREHFGISPEQKVLVATLSSYDEQYSAKVVGVRAFQETLLFDTQLDWIKALLEYLSDRKYLFLIIRVHPREFPNRRSPGLSQHAQLLKQTLSTLPDNVAINWPDDNISMYDFADETDVFLNAWSSVGKEMSILGKPVVLYSREMALYPADLCYVGTTSSDYFEAIEAALGDGWCFERARRCYRWSALETGHALIDIGDSYQHRENVEQSAWSKFEHKLRRLVDQDYRLKRDCQRRAPRLKMADQVVRLVEEEAVSRLDLLDDAALKSVSIEDETAYIKRELVRLADTLFPSPEARAKSRLYQLLTGNEHPPGRAD